MRQCAVDFGTHTASPPGWVSHLWRHVNFTAARLSVYAIILYPYPGVATGCREHILAVVSMGTWDAFLRIGFWGCVVRVSKILSRRSSDPNLSRMTIWKEVIFFSSFIKTMVGPLLIRNTSYTHIVRCEVQHCEKKKNCWDPPSVGCYTCDACKGTWLFSSPALLLSALFIKGKMWSASTYFDSITLRANFSWATQQHSDQRAFEREGTISNPTQIQIFKGTPYTIETAILIHTACIYL